MNRKYIFFLNWTSDPSSIRFWEQSGPYQPTSQLPFNLKSKNRKGFTQWTNAISMQCAILWTHIILIFFLFFSFPFIFFFYNWKNIFFSKILIFFYFDFYFVPNRLKYFWLFKKYICQKWILVFFFLFNFKFLKKFLEN